MGGCDVMAKPLVSVLIPCFNAERYVGAALESVLAQTYAPIQVIVVDDGSTDGSVGVIEPFRARGVTVIHQANAGQCAAANRALTEAKGEYVKFFDADDLLHPEVIARQVRAIAGRGEAIAFGEWARFRDDPAEAVFAQLPMYRDAEPVEWLVSEWTGGAPMTQCAMFLIPRAILLKTGGWDERLSLINDFEFFARILSAVRELVFAPHARLYYRSVPGSLSAQVSPIAAASAALSLRLGTDHLLAAEDSPRTRRAAANMLQTFAYTFYPAFADLRRELAELIDKLGGSDLPPDGPPGFHKLRRWIGWRGARRVQILAEHLGLNRAARRKCAIFDRMLILQRKFRLGS